MFGRFLNRCVKFFANQQIVSRAVASQAEILPRVCLPPKQLETLAVYSFLTKIKPQYPIANTMLAQQSIAREIHFRDADLKSLMQNLNDADLSELIDNLSCELAVNLLLNADPSGKFAIEKLKLFDSILGALILTKLNIEGLHKLFLQEDKLTWWFAQLHHQENIEKFIQIIGMQEMHRIFTSLANVNYFLHLLHAQYRVPSRMMYESVLLNCIGHEIAHSFVKKAADLANFISHFSLYFESTILNLFDDQKMQLLVRNNEDARVIYIALRTEQAKDQFIEKLSIAQLENLTGMNDKQLRHTFYLLPGKSDEKEIPSFDQAAGHSAKAGMRF